MSAKIFVVGCAFAAALAPARAYASPSTKPWPPPCNDIPAIKYRHPVFASESIARCEASGLLRGGPALAVGSRLDADAGEDFVIRGFYEHGHLPWLVYSASLEYDARQHALVTPAIEFATASWRSFLLLPSFGIGVGVPVDLSASTSTGHIGGRILGTVQFPLFGLVLSFDYFPGAASGERSQLLMLGRFSL